MNTFTTRTGTILPPRKARPDVLRGGAAVIREDGLTKGTFAKVLDVHGQQTAHCTVGALMAAVGDHQLDIRSVQPEIDLLVQMLGCPPLHNNSSSVVGIYSWNDAARRTADDVTTLLEQAAEKAEADQ